MCNAAIVSGLVGFSAVVAGYRLNMEYAGKLLAMTFILVVIGADGRAGERLALLTCCFCVRQGTVAVTHQQRSSRQGCKQGTTKQTNLGGRSACFRTDIKQESWVTIWIQRAALDLWHLLATSS